LNGIGASAVAPLVYGLISDAIGAPQTLMVVAGVVLLIVPLALPLRPALRAA
jgi:hypothetical protein